MQPSLEPTPPADTRDSSYDEVAARFAAPLARLAWALESRAPARVLLLQDIHLALWRSLVRKDAQASLRLWVLRAAHNQVLAYQPQLMTQEPANLTWDEIRERRRRNHVGGKSLESWLENPPFSLPLLPVQVPDLVQQLEPLDRSLVLLHLEGVSPDELAGLTALSPAVINARLASMRPLLPANAAAEWQREASGARPVTRDELALRTADLELEARRHDRRQTLASGVLAGYVLLRVLTTNTQWVMLRVGYLVVLLLLALEFAARWRKAGIRLIDDDLGLLATARVHRRNLERERDALLAPWRWHDWLLLLVTPALVLSFPLESGKGWSTAIAAMVLLLGGVSGWQLYKRREAARLQARIDSLPV